MRDEDRPLRDLDWFVFSGHKTATQSATWILRNGGFEVAHAHKPAHVGISQDNLLAHLEDRAAHGRGRLQVLSVFRLPIERHVSSLFQYHGTRPLAHGLVDDPSETLIAREDDRQLTRRMTTWIESGTVGKDEPVLLLCDALGLKPDALSFDPGTRSGTTRLGVADVHLLRFDQIRGRLALLLSSLAGQELEPERRNDSDEKWYADRYREFRTRLRVPARLIEHAHEERRELIELFHPGQFDQLLEAEIARWAGGLRGLKARTRRQWSGITDRA